MKTKETATARRSVTLAGASAKVVIKVRAYNTGNMVVYNLYDESEIIDGTVYKRESAICWEYDVSAGDTLIISGQRSLRDEALHAAGYAIIEYFEKQGKNVEFVK